MVPQADDRPRQKVGKPVGLGLGRFKIPGTAGLFDKAGDGGKVGHSQRRRDALQGMGFPSRLSQGCVFQGRGKAGKAAIGILDEVNQQTGKDVFAQIVPQLVQQL